MKFFKILTLLFMITGMAFGYSHDASASRNCSAIDDGTIIETDPTAAGTKYQGTLTIYYKPSESGPAYRDMYFFLRLRKGSDLYSFSGIKKDVDYENDISGQQAAIMEFVKTIVMDGLYCEWVLITDPADPDYGNVVQRCTPGYETFPVSVKSYDSLIEDMDQYCCNDPDGFLMEFVVLDVVIAVQD